MNQDLLNKVILVTGASSGIGRAIAKASAKRGATVILAARNIAQLEVIYDTIVEKGLPVPSILPLDLSGLTQADCNRIVEHIHNKYHKLDVLIHCAGILGQRAPMQQQEIQQWEQVMNVNVSAPMMLTQTLIPCLERSDNPHIIFSSSSVGKTGRAYWGAYAASKFATEGMVQVWADELAAVSNIKINCVNPGATATPMRAQAYPAENPATIKPPEDVVDLYINIILNKGNPPHGQSIDYS